MSRSRYYKPVLLFLALALVISAAWTQNRMNRSRATLGLTRIDPLENAPPVLAFTTVALGGFRGLIANALWVRATDLQDEGKYFEMVQLAEWITKLQPHFATIWVVQAWNMAYNISIKFQNPKDRWFWVKEGIRLLRDEGLKYNPKETLIYRELAWFFQHKLGQNLDDAHLYFKQAWAEEMTQALGGHAPKYEEWLNPKTPEAKERVKRLREDYKLDVAKMKAVDDRYGPLEWRLPETHAIYWALLGLEKAKREELITLRRVIYQSLQLAFQRGRIIESRTGKLDFGPNLAMTANADRAYEDMMEQDPEYRDHIKTGHRNFLRDSVYFLYTENRLTEAAKWFKVLGEKYPNQPLLLTTNSLPGQISLEDYALDRVTEDVGETSVDRTKAILEGLVTSSYLNLALGFDERAANYDLLARKVHRRFQSQITGQEGRVGMTPLEDIQREVRSQLLSSTNGLEPELQARLRTELGLPAATNAPSVTRTPATTNSPPP